MGVRNRVRVDICPSKPSMKISTTSSPRMSFCFPTIPPSLRLCHDNCHFHPCRLQSLDLIPSALVEVEARSAGMEGKGGIRTEVEAEGLVAMRLPPPPKKPISRMDCSRHLDLRSFRLHHRCSLSLEEILVRSFSSRKDGKRTCSSALSSSCMWSDMARGN